MLASYFVIMSAKSMEEPDAEVTSIYSLKAGQAHEMAANHYRKQRKLPANIHVITRTLGRFESELEATEFLDKLQTITEDAKTA
jgi:hypothetical protein